jgi:hypothetical protein
MDMWKNFKTFYTLAGVTLIGLAMSSICVGLYLYEPMKNKAEEEEKEEELHYRMKYFQELDELEDRKMTKKELKDLAKETIHESTPEGDVIMSYSSDTETFWYYADTKSIQYWVLDTVARMYTIKNNCKSVCVNYQEEFKKGKDKTLSQKEIDEQKEEEKKDEDEKKEKEKSVFANFKSYNKGRGNESKEKKLKKYHIMTEVSNRFTYKGRLSDYEDKDENKEKDGEEHVKKAPKRIDFATFKNRFSSDENKDKIKTL